MKKQSSHIITCLLLLAMIACEAPKTANHYEPAINEARRLMDSLLVHQKIPGMDVAIALKGEIVWSEGFGFADLEHQVPVKAGITRFRIGSVSKPLTSAALGILMDAGKMDLDKPVQSYVPNFPEKKFPISILQVGGHIAGIRHYRNREFLMSKKFTSVQTSLNIFKDDTLLFEPGTRYSYSSYGFNLISAAIEGASGEDFLDYIQKAVFDPLEMSNTTADKNDSIILGRSSFYGLAPYGTVNNAPYVDNSYKWAGGGFISTTKDLVRFGEAHMQAGFLSEQTLSELLTPQVLDNGESTAYGVGWRTWTKNDQHVIGHTGGSIGGITLLQIYPEKEMVMVFLSNFSDTGYGNVPDRIAKLFLDLQEEL